MTDSTARAVAPLPEGAEMAPQGRGRPGLREPSESDEADMPTEPAASPRGGWLAAVSQNALGRLYAFRVTYVAIFVFIVLYVFSVRGAEQLLQSHFSDVVRESCRITDLTIPVTMQIQSRIDRRVTHSRWLTWGGVQATVIVLAADARTWIYVGGRTVQPPASVDPLDIARQAQRLLPVNHEVIISVPHNALLANGILIFYATILLSALFVYNREVSRSEARHLQDAIAERDLTQLRAETISQELAAIRTKLGEVEPVEREHAEEIRKLERERELLGAKLTDLAERETELRLTAARAVELDQERQALEDLLEEAGDELSTRDTDIERLERSLKSASRAAPAGSGRTREIDQLGRRLNTLYKSLEIDSRALSSLVALGDETLKLKAEESLKRLADDTDNVAIRRKVGGLPPHLTIFELGFAGKGRIYYTRGKQRRFRILSVGAKNSQKTDLDYLRKLTLP